ncbi:exopolysaccharide biosynthesis polyprenyl glycosylphosphotransferase [Candidatus Neomarinimicrobiota bacterium]
MIIFIKLVTDSLSFTLALLVFLGLQGLLSIDTVPDVDLVLFLCFIAICLGCYFVALLFAKGYINPNERNLMNDLQLYLRFGFYYFISAWIAFSIFLPTINLSDVIIFIIISFMLLWMFRHLLHAFIYTYYPSFFSENVLVYGLPNSSEMYHSEMRHKFGKYLNIIGFVHANNDRYRTNSNFSCHINDIESLITEFNIRRLIVTDEFEDLPPAAIIKRTNALNITCSFISHTKWISTNHINVNKLPDQALSDRSIIKRILDIKIKRLLDVLFAVPLIILQLPLGILISVLIKLDDGGPIFFIHERIGLNGKKFKLIKYRTLRPDADAYNKSPESKKDPRITKMGKYIRKFSIDELPQLFNVLKGDMSLIGPRPEMPFIVSGYDALTHQRHLVKPGITGVWQISVGRNRPIHDHIECDFFYIEKMSLSLDIIIVMITLRFILKGLTA